MASFEESLKQLEAIIAKLERGDLPLEESVRLFEEGVKLSNACKGDLEAAEGKIQILLKQKDGSRKAEAFPAADDLHGRLELEWRNSFNKCGESLHHHLGNGGQLHVRSTFVNLSNFGVAEKLLHWIILHEAVPAEDFDCLAGNTLGHL